MCSVLDGEPPKAARAAIQVMYRSSDDSSGTGVIWAMSDEQKPFSFLDPF